MKCPTCKGKGVVRRRLRVREFVVTSMTQLSREDVVFFRSLYDVDAGPDDEIVTFPSGLTTTWGEIRHPYPGDRFIARRPKGS